MLRLIPVINFPIFKEILLNSVATRPQAYPHRLSVAPMLDWTDRHCRYFHRLLSRHALLYTEMVTTGALIHGDVARHLRYNVDAVSYTHLTLPTSDLV